MKHLMVAVIATALGGVVMGAPDNESAKQSAIELNAVSITASKQARNVSDIPGTVSVQDSEDLESQLVSDLRDVLRYEPGVSTGANGQRFQGFDGVAIRGLGEDRVLTLIDGVPVQDSFSFGPFFAVRQSLLDWDMVKQVEIVRGSTSALYGSDAIAGVFSLQTVDPSDLLARTDREWYVRVKAEYATKNDELAESVAVARKFGKFEALVSIVRRDHDELKNEGTDKSEDTNRTAANPQDTESNQLMAKGVYRINDHHSVKFAAEIVDDSTDTDVYTDQGVRAGIGTVDSAETNEDYDKQRYSIEHNLSQVNAGILDEVKSILYYQTSETVQDFERVRTDLTAVNRRDTRESLYEEESWGINVDLYKAFTSGAIDHNVVYGVAYSQDEISEFRKTLDTNLGTNAVITNAEAHDFPNTETTTWGVFLQDEMLFMEERLAVIPALRWDDYDISPQGDALFDAAVVASGFQAESLHEDAVSPKLGVRYSVDENYTVFANYARGFRAPRHDEINSSFTNPGLYRTAPNPELRPERSHNREIGVKGNFKKGGFAVAYFNNKYKDFIESTTTTVAGLLVGEFKSENIGEVDIDGFEITGHYRIDKNWYGRAAYANHKGFDRVNSQPLQSVDPNKAVVGMGYNASKQHWGAEFTGTKVWGKEEQNNQALFIPDGHYLADLTGFYKPTKQWTIRAGIFNIMDRKYFDWQDVRGQNSGGATLDRFTAAGRNASISVAYVW